MKLFQIFSCALLISYSASAQKNIPTTTPVVLPVDPITHLITYEGVIQVQGATTEMLFKRALDWFNSYYKNPTEVIRENDIEKGKIVGKPRFRISNLPDKEGTKTDAGLVQYTITVGVKEGRFKYELTEFNWKQTSYYPLERWMDTKAQTYTPVYNHYLTQTDDYVKDMIKNLKGAMMSDKQVKDKDNW